MDHYKYRILEFESRTAVITTEFILWASNYQLVEGSNKWGWPGWSIETPMYLSMNY